jgi:hypothetical protein
MNFKKLAILSSVLTLTSAYSYAAPVTLTTNDIYRAENDHGYGDTIGAVFDISSVVVTRDNDTEVLNIGVNTIFAGGAGYQPTWTQNGLGVGYGDVLFGTYIPSTQDTTTDLWGTISVTHAFVLNDPWNNTGGTGALYATDDLSLVLTDNLISSGLIYRNTAPVMVNRSDPDLATATALATGTWSVGSGVLTFNINDFTIDPEIAYWTMGCGNDIAFGYVPEGGGGGQGGEVPEPNTMFLGLAGIGLILRKKYLS